MKVRRVGVNRFKGNYQRLFRELTDFFISKGYDILTSEDKVDACIYNKGKKGVDLPQGLKC